MIGTSARLNWVFVVFCQLLQFTNIGGLSSHDRTISVVISTIVVKIVKLKDFFRHSIIHYLVGSKIVARSSKIAGVLITK